MILVKQKEKAELYGLCMLLLPTRPPLIDYVVTGKTLYALRVQYAVKFYNLPCIALYNVS